MSVQIENMEKELKSFGVIFGVMVALVFGLLVPYIFSKQFSIWPWIIMLAFILVAYIKSLWLKPIYNLWMKFGKVMNKLTTPLILGSIFYIMITPMGVFMRLIGKNPLKMSYDNNLSSYRAKSLFRDKESIERPF